MANCGDDERIKKYKNEAIKEEWKKKLNNFKVKYHKRK